MKLALIGVGQAGGKVVDEFLAYDAQTGADIVRGAIAVNTAKADLNGIDRLPEDRRILIGQSRVKGHGVGADNELGAEVAEEDIDEIQGALDSVPVHEIDAFLVVAGLGGGTGSGGAPVIAKNLKRIYTEPVYGLGILPGSDEGGIYTLNAARSLKTFVDEVDNLMLFDNDAWRSSGESVGEGFDAINRELVQRFGVLFSAGEITEGSDVAESVVDSSEIINTLKGGGISSLGYADVEVDEPKRSGLLSRFGNDSNEGIDSTEATNRITSLVRKATLGRLTLPCEVSGTERALLVVAGPPEYLNRKGIEHGRKWLEEQTGSMEVRGGDYPRRGEGTVAGLVLLGGVTNVPRVKELQQVAVEAQQNLGEITDESEDRFTELMDSDGELESLF
ncbi:tubulin/FtsZ family protein [Halorubrum ezzemoulense]|uniref:Tubulin-like protein CetZ n=2 Tax=Halorubrum ezzemoulense TaxID=337243 RepID=A0A256KFJ1_HALEZ|nr:MULTISPECIES: tubulin/FtsZ family protein [Halorubrum]MDB2237614.1 tubulin/FtsZ family protein [Halorubrum ezzemoulense]MDB2248892.1 tubulin/FtsZ family protein [Halorubrum ezzemoulense]MDB2261177.1 tubulin/FtsZ family protein [Halorubrum ezzemoulense]MDB2267645.1 tubulin/FtsZ family protein [Halorubrum ezzemoulense]MDB2270509.1 tubulin/FtsZ family protein [Halorubrum ezzemoulense]